MNSITWNKASPTWLESRKQALREAIEVVRREKVEEFGQGDEAYNLALHHACLALEALQDRT